MANYDTEIWKTEIENEVKLLDEMEAGTDEYKATIDGLTKLTDRVIELEKLQLQREQYQQSKFDKLNENSLRKEQLKKERNDSIISNIIKLAGIGVAYVAYNRAIDRELLFEEKGLTTTTIFGRETFKKLLNFKMW